MSSGGGSVAKQFAAGGTMDGTLNVNGNILSGGRNLDDIFSTETAAPCAQDLQSVTNIGSTTTNLISSNNIIIADTILATNILSATNLDIGFELSGFNVTGSISANGNISSGSLTTPALSTDGINTEFIGTVSGITQSMVGLANVCNTSDANKPVSTAQQSALNLKANLASPTFTDSVTVVGNLSASGNLSGANIVGNSVFSGGLAVCTSVPAQTIPTLQAVTDEGNSTTGSIGVGVTAPTSKLHVKNTSSGNVVRQLRLHNDSTSAGTGAGIAFTSSTSETFVNASIDSVRATSTANGNLVFSTRADTTGDDNAVIERMRINPTGEVSINTVPVDGIDLNTRSLSSLSLSANSVFSGGLAVCTSVPAQTIPSLQQVTTQGNTTTNSLSIGELSASKITGGANSINTGAGSFIGGGLNNKVTGACASVIGGKGLSATGFGSIAAGGYRNCAGAGGTFVGSGRYNCARGSYSNIGSGYRNETLGTYSVVGGGFRNKAHCAAGFVGGGKCNQALSGCSTIGGGGYSCTSGIYSTIGGGKQNKACGTYSNVLGGANNTASNVRSAIVGGKGNTTSGINSFIGGGYYSTASGNYSVIAGGTRNYATGNYSFIGSGQYKNCATGSQSFVGTGLYNFATGSRSTIINGGFNRAHATTSFIGGGYYNCTKVGTGYSSVVGGIRNQTCGNCSAVVGGRYNCAIGHTSTVVNGENNRASGANSFIAGGVLNCVNVGHNCSFIIGTGITSNAACTTFVNNLSSQGIINSCVMTSEQGVKVGGGSIFTCTGSFSPSLSDNGKTLLLDTTSGTITVSVTPQISGFATRYIKEAGTAPVVFSTGTGLSGLYSYQDRNQMSIIYAQADIFFKSNNYAFLGGNLE